MQCGYIKLQRQLQNHWLWQDKRKFSKAEAFIDMIFRCNHKCAKVLIGNTFHLVKRGQFISSNVKLGEAWNWDEKSVRNFVKLLEADNMVKVESTKKFTLYEVSNYSEHQSIDTTAFESKSVRAKSEQNPNRIRTASEQNPTNNNDNNDFNSTVTIGMPEIKLFFENNGFGLMTRHFMDGINQFLDDGIEPGLILEALKKAKNKNITNWDYASKIISSSFQKGITTLEQFVADQIRFENEKKNKPQQKTYQSKPLRREFTEADLDIDFSSLKRKG